MLREKQHGAQSEIFHLEFFINANESFTNYTVYIVYVRSTGRVTAAC